MSDDFEWQERVCPLPVIRKHWDEDGNEVSLSTEVCGEALYVAYDETKCLLVGGEVDTCGPTWKVECGNGHVLVLPDHEADDNFNEIPFELQAVSEALYGTLWAAPIPVNEEGST